MRDAAAIAAKARAMISRPERATEHVWARAATHLVRQALEAAIDAHWAKKQPSVRRASRRNQLVCLPYYLKDDESLARRVIWAWYASSAASHHHGFELAATAADLLAWLEVAEALAARGSE